MTTQLTKILQLLHKTKYAELAIISICITCYIYFGTSNTKNVYGYIILLGVIIIDVMNRLYWIRYVRNKETEVTSLQETVQKKNATLYSTQVQKSKAVDELRQLRLDNENLQKELDDHTLLDIDDIYQLYQIYLLIRKYNIIYYKITTHPTILCDVYCKMSTYTKISINRELLDNVQYHIEGTNVILKKQKEEEK